MLVRRLGCSSSFPRRQLLAPWPLVRKMASGTLPVIVLSSSSDSEGGEGEEKRQTARKRKIDDGDGDASRPPRPRPPPAAAAAASASVPSPPPATIATPLSFDRCDPLVSCGFALTATPNLERESGHEECNATVDRGARLADLVSSCSGSSLKSALVSNFMVDPVWLFTTLPALRNVEGHLAIVMGDDRMVEATRQSLLVFASKKALSSTVTRPPTEAFGTHHSKFFVLEYGWGVCVIVVTGNFIPHEYDSKTQGLWFQRFPWKDAESPESSDFEEVLSDYISKLKLSSAAASSALLGSLRRCDFSSARADLITSVPGNHKGAANYRRYATGRLGWLLSRAKGFSDSLAGSQLVAQCSSLGRLNEVWLGSWAEAASGGTTRGGAPLGPPTTGKKKKETSSPSPLLPLSIVWPTAEEVRTSVEGWSGGGSVPGRSETLALPSISSRLCRWEGGNGGDGSGSGSGRRILRGRAVPHLKTFVRADQETGQVAWCEVGSSNFSIAAWGSATKSRDSSYVRSWELGVLLLPEREAAYRRHRHRGFNGGEVSGGSGGGTTTTTTTTTTTAPFPPGSLLHAACRTREARVGPFPAGAGAGGDVELVVEFYAAGRAPGQTTATAAATEAAAGASNPASTPTVVVERVELPLPYPLPPPRYRPGKDRAWVTDAAFPGADSLGRYLSPN